MPGGAGVNMTRKPEMVLNPSQSRALEDNIRGSGCNHKTVVEIDGLEVAHQSRIEDNDNQLIEDLRRGY